MSTSALHRLDRLACGIVLAVSFALVLAAATSAEAYVLYRWKSGVSGLTSDSSKWNPAGVPTYADFLEFSASGTYTVTFPSATPETSRLACSTGVVTFQMTSPHTTSGFYVAQSSFADALTFNQGFPGAGVQRRGQHARPGRTLHLLRGPALQRHGQSQPREHRRSDRARRHLGDVRPRWRALHLRAERTRDRNHGDGV
jgi:hypothetical protein